MTTKYENDIDALKTSDHQQEPIAICGIVESDTYQYAYIQDDGKNTPTELLNALLDAMKKDYDCTNDGSLMFTNTVIITPEKVLLHCIAIAGNKVKWYEGFFRAASNLGLLMGKIIIGLYYVDNAAKVKNSVNIENYKRTGSRFYFIISDLGLYKLSACTVHSIAGDCKEYEARIKELRAML